MPKDRRWFRRRFRTVIVGVLVGATTLLWPPAAGAGSGDLDPTFGDGGQVTTSFAGSSSVVDMARVGTRILVVAGVFRSGEPRRIGVARFLQNGHLDTAFGNGGKVVVGFTGGSVDPSAIVALNDGRFVVGGTFSPKGGGRSSFALVRFLQGGGLDTSFGNHGRVVADLGPGRWFLLDLVRQANGKLVGGGEMQETSGSFAVGFGLARFAADGSIDRSYGTDGHVVTLFGSDSISIAS